MNQVECVLFDCDGTLVDSEVLCSKAYVHMFAHYGIELALEEVFKKYKGIKLYEIIERVNAEQGVNLPASDLEPIFRQEVARLFDAELQPIAGARELLAQMNAPMCTVSNGPVSKMQHSLGLTDMLSYFDDRLFSGYDIQRWKPDPAIVFHAAQQMQVPVERCILVDDSVAGAQAGIAAGIPVFYFCADPHNQPIDHPLVTTFDDLAQLPALWQQRGWQLTR
ncbi:MULTISPECIES: 6-phosphogluconate phosphatase [Serratia]|jgi:HAD superfamily hydrolase (TIGR01509 family)|uniref:6-phosphogluconate phosphatase n=1 Tax=Serratia TaxID=613 RepID=UPI000EF4A1A5|nr:MULTISPECIES: 6-phosphogluconate phosphatase [Serratia]AYM92654.1 6-phosphogluconate phosphatase [Serratia sp. 3ACOL1]MBL5904524.1 6-phosphogluconate phosphatase [Serratia fonticola]MDK2376633.1 6-phosphogluconate phosphatase [Serratia fonticola]CAI1776654.1 Phosphorylated carbohydrates phosphatase TM_1254 [Serratia fonticola]CAI1969219.1 Phosphorylated carbohydrates phosphatase TM_1254 [Serratia fonticola]